MDKKTFYYYSIKCLKTNKEYIGITENLERRWSQHLRMLEANQHHSYKLQKDWNLYGKENFVFEQIDQLEATVEDGYNHEKELIEQRSSYTDGYNVLIGGEINPIYTKEVYEKMVASKQEQVENIFQLKEIGLNHFQIIRKWNSKKEPHRLAGFDFRNICHSIEDRILGNGFYWVEESKLSTWKPSLGSMKPVAEIDDDGNVLQVRRSTTEIEKENGWGTSCIINSIKRNGKTHGRKFKQLTEEEFYKYYPIMIEPVQTIPEA